MLIKKILTASVVMLLGVSATAGEYTVIEARAWDDGSLRLQLEDVNNPGTYLSNPYCYSDDNNTDGNLEKKDYVFTDRSDGAMTDRALSIALSAQMTNVTVNADIHEECYEKYGDQRSQLTYIELAL